MTVPLFSLLGVLDISLALYQPLEQNGDSHQQKVKQETQMNQ